MKNSMIRFLAPTILVLAIISAAVAAAPSKHAKKWFELSGKVLKVDQKERTMLVAETNSDKLYIVKVPEGAYFRITFGINMRYEYPELRHVFRADRIRARCTADEDHLARLDDGRVVHVVTAASN
jgi:hypothetical protein